MSAGFGLPVATPTAARAPVRDAGWQRAARSAVLPRSSRALPRRSSCGASPARAGCPINVLCGIQAAAVLVGLGANAAAGAWWLDPLIGLFIAFVAVKEGREAWNGETCADCAAPLAFVAGDTAHANGDCCGERCDCC